MSVNWLIGWKGKVVEISCVGMEMEHYLSSDSVQICFYQLQSVK